MMDPTLSLAFSLVKAGRFDEAVALAKRLASTQSRNAGVIHALGGIYDLSHRFDEALRCFQRAVKLAPQEPAFHCDLAYALLSQGQFRQGWAEHEWRHPDIPGPAPRWKGQPITGKTLLIRPEQGYGDCLFFLRYARLLANQGVTVILGTYPPLERLLAGCPEIATMVPGQAVPAFDYWCPMGSLPHLCGTHRVEQIPPAPYLAPAANLTGQWETRLAERLGAGKRLRVGVAWAGSPAFGGDGDRSPGFAPLRPLLAVPDVSWVSLQIGPRAADGAGFLLDVSADIHDFADTAAVMSRLDLVISSDTSTANLAGALGVPVWVALSWLPDWRWMHGRADSPWYGSARLYRQARPGDWASVFDAMATDLVTLT